MLLLLPAGYLLGARRELPAPPPPCRRSRPGRALAGAATASGAPCRRVALDGGTPAWVEAELLARDWRSEQQLHLVLAADDVIRTSDGPTAGSDQLIRSVGEDLDDRAALRTFFRIDHEEEGRRANRSTRSEHETDQALDVRQGLSPPAQYFTAVRDGQPAGMVCIWLGDGGPAVVEDVFVHPDHRHHGIASALIAHAVGWGRDHGAGAVLIAADPSDTPKDLYVRLGFVPVVATGSLTAPPAAMS